LEELQEAVEVLLRKPERKRRSKQNESKDQVAERNENKTNANTSTEMLVGAVENAITSENMPAENKSGKIFKGNLLLFLQIA
jgi:hypothetical protein